MCGQFDEEGCTSHKEYTISSGTPTGYSFQWNVDPSIPSGTDYVINTRVSLDAADPTNTVTSSRGPYNISQPCVDIVIETRTGTWGAEMEWKLWDGVDTTHPIVHAKNSPESIIFNTPDMFPTDAITEHYRFASGYQGQGVIPGATR